MSAERQIEILTEYIAGRESDRRLAGLALVGLAEHARNAEHYKEACVSALAELGNVDEPDAHERLLQAAHTLGQALTFATEEIPRPLPDVVSEGITPEGVEIVSERETPVDGYHTIPVPAGWTIEQAWETIVRGEGIPAGDELRWAVVEVEEGKFVRVIPKEALEEFDTGDPGGE